MTCSRKLRPRIEFLPPEKKEKVLNHPLRDIVEEHEDRQKKWEDWKKAQVQAALNKQQEGAQKRIRSIFNFVIGAHVLFIVEFAVYKIFF